ncbi:putative host specificity protein, partial [Escherichia coli O157:H- str. 493-89]
FKGKITESHLGKELLEKGRADGRITPADWRKFSKEWKDANDKWNAMWAVKIEQTEDGKHYVAGLGLKHGGYRGRQTESVSGCRQSYRV